MTLIETLDYFIRDQQGELQGLEWDIREETNQEDPDLDWYCNEYDEVKGRLENLEKIKSIILGGEQMRFRNIEFRWSKHNDKYELVKWYHDNCSGEENFYVIAFFDEDREGYNMRTIGNRFFKDEDAWVVGKYALEFLNAIFILEQDELNYD